MTRKTTTRAAAATATSTTPTTKDIRTIPDEAREKAIKTRQDRSIFNRYLASMNSKRAMGTQARIDAIDIQLDQDTRERKVPKFSGGKRDGIEKKTLPLQPSAKAKLLARRNMLLTKLLRMGNLSLREQFLAVLPGYMASQRWDRDILLQVGVPVIDLDEAGIL